MRPRTISACVLRALLVLALVSPNLFAGGAVARAAPASGGTFTVNSANDTITADSVLTLREALLIARGGTGAAKGLNRALTNAEKAQLSGCTIDGSNFITNGCGAGFSDAIGFNVPILSIITLVSPLPLIDDSAPTSVDGGATFPVIYAKNLGAGADGLVISSDNNSVTSLIVENSPQDNFRVQGSNNLLSSVHSWSAGVDGIGLAGSSNTVDGSIVGIGLFGGCVGAGTFGIRILASTQYNTISNSTIGCNAFGGIAVMDYNGAGNHTIGPNNVIGAAVAGDAIYQNGLFGIEVDSNSNTIMSNTIGLNGGDGIGIYRGFNTVTGNTVISNTGSGVRLYGFANNSYIGCGVLCLSVDGNRFSGNLRYGVEITGSAVANNFVEANLVGVDASGNHAQGNMLGGALVDGAYNNVIGDTGSRRNTFSGNAGDGVRLAHGAYANTVAYNYIGTNSHVNNIGNSGNGITLLSGAHDNTVGQSDPAYVNEIVNNQLNGILIDGSGTTLNTILRNRIYSNLLDGMHVSNGANRNLIGQTDYNQLNSVYDNRSGLALTSGTYSNLIGFNAFDNNARHGIVLSGTGTSGNVISLTMIYQNQLDGINEGNGADFNMWTRLSNPYGVNGGLGIDTSALDDANNTVSPPFPIITSVMAAGGIVIVQGTASGSGPIFDAPTVELYRVYPNASGYGEGRSYIASATALGSGNWSMSFSAASAGCYTAFQTQVESSLSVSRSSEYGPNSCRLYLPAVRR